MPKRKFFFALLPLALCLFAGCSMLHHEGKTKALPGTWQQQPIVIDGDNRDWPSPYPNYDSKSKIGYATSNDEQYLYITMETGDELTQMKILKCGMVLSIDTGGKKNAKFSVSYPLQNDNSLFEIPKAEDRKPRNGMTAVFPSNRQFQKNVTNSIEAANQFVLDGFMYCNGAYLISQTTPCGIKIAMKLDEYKELVWEAAIPFKALYDFDKLPASKAGKPISVCFTIRADKKTGTKGNDNVSNPGMNSMSGSSMRGGSASGMHGGGGRTAAVQDNPFQLLYETTKTWKFFGLAAQAK
jgi:hypothetical protein